MAVIYGGRWIGLIIDFAAMHYLCSDGPFPTDLWESMTDYPQFEHGFEDMSPQSIPTTKLHEGFAWARAVAFLETVCLSDAWSDQVFAERFAKIVGDAPVLEVPLLRLPHPNTRTPPPLSR